MRNNDVFLRVLAYIDTNNIPKAQIMAATDEQFLAVMFPPDGERPADDFTHISAIKRALAHVYRERKQVARVDDLIARLTSQYPQVSVVSQGSGQYLVTIGDGDE
jgi:hypothetical protein